MNFLLDTQIFIWMMLDDQRITPALRARLEAPGCKLFVSFASLWEMAIKVASGKSGIPGNDVALAVRFAAMFKITILPIKAEHLFHLQTLPRLHRDPFDRIIVCQATIERMQLVSADHMMNQYLPDTIS